MSKKTTFSLLDKEVVLDIDQTVISDIIEKLLSNNSLREAIDILSTKWDKENILSLIEYLIDEEVIVDGKNLTNYISKLTSNPQIFQTTISKEGIKSLTEDAIKEQRKTSPVEEYSPEKSFFSEILIDRKSVRNFSSEKIDFQKVINILWAGYGETSNDKINSSRTVPSAGALYPIQLRLVILNNEVGLGCGIYSVNFTEEGKLGLNKIGEDIDKVRRSYIDPYTPTHNAAGVIVICGSFSRPSAKYGNRSFIYVPLEAGHVAQNILIEATRQKVDTVEIGGFIDDLLIESLNLENSYRPITSIVFGKEDQNMNNSEKLSQIEIDWAIPMSDIFKPDFAIASVRLSPKRSWSHGRDKSPEIALIKAMSEAKEWTSCGNVPELTYAKYNELSNVINPIEIISFHDSQYARDPFPFVRFDKELVYGWTKGLDLSGKEWHILADHVYFPYFPETPYHCYANSSGCAAHPSLETAVELGTLELIERDSFMNTYLNRLSLPRIKESSLPGQIQKRIHDLKQVGFDVKVIDHSLDLAPVAFVFAQNKELGYTTVASCSSFDSEHAISHALMEVEASILHRLQTGQPNIIKPEDVIMPLDHGRLYGQRKFFTKANFLVESKTKKSFAKFGEGCAKNFEDLISRFSVNKWKLITIPLSLGKEYGESGNLNIVRVIVPGTVQMTFGANQEPGGMSRIYDISHRFGTGKKQYQDLVRFPHPFE